MRCAFGAHLDVGLAERRTPLRPPCVFPVLPADIFLRLEVLLRVLNVQRALRTSSHLPRSANRAMKATSRQQDRSSVPLVKCMLQRLALCVSSMQDSHGT